MNIKTLETGIIVVVGIIIGFSIVFAGGWFNDDNNIDKNNNIDERAALKYLSEEFGYNGGIPEGYRLHHNIDNGSFQFVQTEVHEEFSHNGGRYYNQ